MRRELIQDPRQPLQGHRGSSGVRWGQARAVRGLWGKSSHGTTTARGGQSLISMDFATHFSHLNAAMQVRDEALRQSLEHLEEQVWELHEAQKLYGEAYLIRCNDLQGELEHACQGSGTVDDAEKQCTTKDKHSAVCDFYTKPDSTGGASASVLLKQLCSSFSIQSTSKIRLSPVWWRWRRRPNQFYWALWRISRFWQSDSLIIEPSPLCFSIQLQTGGCLNN